MLGVKNPPANAGDISEIAGSLGLEDLLEEGMATHSSIHAWRILYTEEPPGLWSIGLQRVGHDSSNLTYTQTHTHNHILNIFLTFTIFFLIVPFNLFWLNVFLKVLLPLDIMYKSFFNHLIKCHLYLSCTYLNPPIFI